MTCATGWIVRWERRSCAFGRRSHLAGVVLLLALLTSAGSEVHAAEACQRVSYAAERAKLQRLLQTSGYTKAEQAFLVRGTEGRLREVEPGSLNGRGTRCGVEAVRALVIACLSHTLPSTLRSTPLPDRRIDKAQWGKTNPSAREAAFVGMFHACRGSAAEVFLSGS